jgi:hypothetical protein
MLRRVFKRWNASGAYLRNSGLSAKPTRQTRSLRTVIEDLIGYVGGEQSYILRCELMDKGFCFISVLQDTIRKPPTAPQSGICSALGYDGY